MTALFKHVWKKVIDRYVLPGITDATWHLPKLAQEACLAHEIRRAERRLDLEIWLARQ